jgi:hypothetical protein
LANKTQAKAAIDAANVAIKDDIDNRLPVGVDITNGNLSFNPTRWQMVLNTTSQATADSWTTSIEAALTLQGKTWLETRGGRRGDDTTGKYIMIASNPATYVIKGF